MAVSLSDSPPSQGPSCPVCYRDYSDSQRQLIPRILQCGHTYCSECLDRLLNTEPDEDDYQHIVLNIRYAGREWTTTRNYPRSRYSANELKCPTCMTMNPVQNKDVSSLTKNFALLGCLQQPSLRHKHFCRDHNHEKRIYCSDCKTLICAYCQLYGGHTGHSYEVATEASKPSVAALKEVESGLLQDLEKLGNGKKEVSRTIKKLVRTRAKCERSVKTYFDVATKKLETEKNHLLTQIDSWTEEQKYILDAQQEMLAKSSKELKSLQASCQSLIVGDPLDALTGHQEVEEEVQRVQSQVSSLSLQPLIHPWMRAKVGYQEVCQESLHTIVDNFKLTYDTDAGCAAKNQDGVGEGTGSSREVGTGQNTDSGSDSSVSNITDDMDSFPDMMPKGRQDCTCGPAEGRANDDGGMGQETLYSQESHNPQSNPSTITAIASGNNISHGFSIGHDQSWVPSVNQVTSLHSFDRPRRRVVNRDPSRESESTGSDAEDAHPLALDLPGYRMPLSRLIGRRMLSEATSDNSTIQLVSPSIVLDVSSDDSDREHVQPLSGSRRSPESSLGGRSLEPLEIRRHWEFLNDRLEEMDGAVGGTSAKDEEAENEEVEEEMATLHSLIYDPIARSPPPSEDSSPSPRSFLNSSSNDFAYPYHLTLPGDASREDEEVVFPSPPFLSWGQRTNPLQLHVLGLFEGNYTNSNEEEEDAASNSEDSN